MNSRGKQSRTGKPSSSLAGRRSRDANLHEDLAEDLDDPDSGPEEKVGYGQPPRHSRFKPGQSGNPKGRPKAARSLQEQVSEVFLKQRKVMVNGRPVRMPTIRIALSAMVERAMRGDLAALRTIMPLLVRTLDAPDSPKALEILPEDDRQLLADFAATVADRQKRLGSEGDR